MRKLAQNLGVEELSRVLKMAKTRADTRAEADVLFGDTAKEMRKADRAKMDKLFVQALDAITMAPNLQKEASITPALDEYFAKLSEPQYTDAQRRYPELMKASEAKVLAPNLKKRTATESQGTPPVQSGLSGGSA